MLRLVNRQIKFIIFLILLPGLHPGITQDLNTENSVITAPLFSREEPVELIIETDFKDLISNKDSEDPSYRKAILILKGKNEDKKTFEIKVKARGYSRRTYDFCSFPPLMLNFRKKTTKGTLFDGQDKLKLVTYCNNTSFFENYVLKEYLVYKVFNILTDTSFRVRLAHITYINSGNQKEITTRFGFLIEDIDALADRLGGKEIEMLLPHHDLCDHTTLDRFMLFQYMIGNVDWWIARPKIHNVKLISVNSSPPIPIPYDFDYSGAVNANYATPPEELQIASVRQRLFRGFCRKRGEYEKPVKLFLDKKEEIYKLYKDFPYLSEGIRKNTLKYYDQFYEIISDPGQIKKRIYDACTIRHTHLHEQ